MERRHIHDAAIAVRNAGNTTDPHAILEFAEKSLSSSSDIQAEYHWTRQNRGKMPSILVRETAQRLQMTAAQLGILSERAQLGERINGVPIGRFQEIHGSIPVSLSKLIDGAKELEDEDLLQSIYRNPQFRPFMDDAISMTESAGANVHRESQLCN